MLSWGCACLVRQRRSLCHRRTRDRPQGHGLSSQANTGKRTTIQHIVSMQCTTCMHDQIMQYQSPRHDRRVARVRRCIWQVLAKVVPFLKEMAFYAFVKMCQMKLLKWFWEHHRWVAFVFLINLVYNLQFSEFWNKILFSQILMNLIQIQIIHNFEVIQINLKML